MSPFGIPSYQPATMGTTHIVASNSSLASAAGVRVLEQGRNAVDAGVATGLAIDAAMTQMKGRSLLDSAVVLLGCLALLILQENQLAGRKEVLRETIYLRPACCPLWDFVGTLRGLFA